MYSSSCASGPGFSLNTGQVCPNLLQTALQRGYKHLQ
jgi:hypothetical protein